MVSFLGYSFEKLFAHYQNKRSQFKQCIDNFQTRGATNLYKRGTQLLDQADRLVHELQASPTGADAQAKVKTLKKTYKALVELTKPVWRQWAESIIVALGLALILRNFIFGLYHVPTGSAEPNILVGDRLWGNKMVPWLSPIKRGDLVIFDDPTFDYGNVSALGRLWQRYVGLPIFGLGTGPMNWVKRVIAVPGDVIEGRIENDKTVIYLNGKKLDEPYVNPFPLILLHKTSGFIPWSHLGPLSVPSFLVYQTKPVNYTYDPSKPVDQQPYYVMNEDEIIRQPGSNQPILDKAFAPIYDRRSGRCFDVFGPYTVPAGKYWAMGDSRKNSKDSRWWLFLDEKLIHGRASFVIWSLDSEEPIFLFDLLKHPIDFWTKHVRWNRFFKGLNGYKLA